jgi:heparanase 1
MLPLSIQILLFVLLPYIVAFPNGTGNTVMFAPFLSAPISIVPATYLSFNFDWNLNQSSNDAWTNASIGWTLDLQNPKLIQLARSLSPANLRIGGSSADVAEYEFGGHVCSQDAIKKHVCLTKSRWNEIIHFVQKTNLRLIFDLNIMFGRDDSSSSSSSNNEWDDTNAQALLKYTQKTYPNWSKRTNLGFELGNEKEFILSPLETANSFIQLRSLVNTIFDTDRPIIVGPSMNVRTDWLTNFLTIINKEKHAVIDVISYHMYPGYGRSNNLPSLIMRPSWLDFSHTVADQVLSSIRMSSTTTTTTSSTSTTAEVWIDETAAAWASGTAGVCNGYLSGFWYLDQLASMVKLA